MCDMSKVWWTLFLWSVEFIKLDVLPWLMFLYMFNEYTPVINVRIDKGIINIIEKDIVEVISIISLRRLIVGGAAMLIAENMNHHIDIDGIILIIPFIKNILRVW